MNAPSTDPVVGRADRSETQAPVSFFEKVVYVWAILELASGPLEPWRLSRVGFFDGYINAERYLMIGAAAYLVGSNRAAVLRMARRVSPMISLVALYFLSAVWSIGPGWSLEQATNAAGITLMSIVFVARLSPARQLRLLAVALSIGTWLSILVALFVPSIGQVSETRLAGWNGVYAHPNFLGANVILGLICLLPIIRPLIESRSAWLIPALVTFPIGVALIVRSQANTALYALVAVVAAEAALWVFRPWLHVVHTSVLGALAAAAMSAIIVGGFWSVSKVPRWSTLSGRTVLWSNLRPFLRQQWWNGYGYAQFFQGAKGYNVALAAWIVDEYNHAHNAFLQVMLDVGIVGFVLLAAAFLLAGRTAFRLTLVGSPRAFPARALWVFVFVTNLTEAYMISTTSIMWMVLVVLLSWGALVSAKPGQGRRRLAATG